MYHQNTFMTPVENPDSCKIMLGYYHVQENQQESQGVEELKSLGSLPLKTERHVAQQSWWLRRWGGTKIDGKALLAGWLRDFSCR